MRRYLLFAPSLLLGLVGGVWLLLQPAPLTPRLPLLGLLGVGLLLAAGLLGGAWLLERTLPSFRYATRLLEQAMAEIPLGLPLVLALAVATAVSEELFFRGALLPRLGVWGQALLFGLLHPAPRRGWSYTAYTAVAGLVFGYATLWSGSLWPALMAHFLINLQGFFEVWRRQRRRAAQDAARDAAQAAAREEWRARIAAWRAEQASARPSEETPDPGVGLVDRDD